MKTILCRLGLHSWKPVFRYERILALFNVHKSPEFPWVQTGLQCRRCKRSAHL